MSEYKELMPRPPETMFGMPILEVDDLFGLDGELVLGPLTEASLNRVVGEMRRTWRTHPEVVAFAAQFGMTTQEMMDERHAALLERAEY